MAEVISEDYLKPATEKEVFINIHEVKNSFTAGGNHLFDFLLNYKFLREVPFDERVTVFCQMISMFEEDFDVTEKFNRYNEIEYAVVYPK
jgi:hypothetical protein